MEEVFSCRNCVHNPCQSLNIGVGSGFCLQHASVIWDPEKTTCKYLHRKDLPYFVVNEGVSEHAAEFAHYSSLVNLETKNPIERLPYSEKFAWERGLFDPMVHAIAQYHKTEPAWTFIQSFVSGIDGRAALVQSSLIRCYMDHCGTWRSSYRLVLAFLQTIDVKPVFDPHMLRLMNGEETSNGRKPEDIEAIQEEALWDVVFSKIASLQEYGFHAGMENLMWVTDHLGDGLIDFDWTTLQKTLTQKRQEWTEQIIVHAKAENVFFPAEAGNFQESSQE